MNKTADKQSRSRRVMRKVNGPALITALAAVTLALWAHRKWKSRASGAPQYSLHIPEASAELGASNLVGAESPENPESAENRENPESAENPENPERAENPENPESAENPENPERAESAESAESASTIAPIVQAPRKLLRTLINFIITSLTSYLSIGAASWILLLIASHAREDIAKVASQASAGLSSTPLMAASVALISISSFLLIGVTAVVPALSAKQRDLLYKPFSGVINYSIQLPFALAGAALPSALYNWRASSKHTELYQHLQLLGVCIAIAMTEAIIAYWVGRGIRTRPERDECFLTISFAAGALLLFLTLGADVINWKQVTN